MSYSRWTNSIWYTFWSSSSPNDIFKKDQVFEICDYDGLEFTYEELKEDLEGCLEQVKLHYSLEREVLLNENLYINRQGELTLFEKKINKKPIKLKEYQIEELREYMLKFIKEVDEDDSLI